MTTETWVRHAPSHEAITTARRLLALVAVLAVVGTVLALVLVSRIGRTYRDGLEVARDSAVVAAQGTGQVQDLTDDVVRLTQNASDALVELEGLITSSASATSDVADALQTNVSAAIEGTASIADGIAAVVRSIDRILPGSNSALTDDLTELADGLEPLPAQLRSLGGELSATAGELSTATSDLDRLTANLDDLVTNIGAASSSLVEADEVATDIAERANEALERADNTLLILRLIILVVGAGALIAALATRRAIGALEWVVEETRDEVVTGS